MIAAASLLVLGLAVWSRLHKIETPDIVAWDEAHFGKFAGYYLKNEFYFDVHPPGGKALLGLAGHLAGYNGTWSFGSGEVGFGARPFVYSMSCVRNTPSGSLMSRCAPFARSSRRWASCSPFGLPLR